MTQQPHPDLEAFLRQHKIHVTKSQLLTLKAILEKDDAVFCAKTIMEPDDSINRVSAYRALQLFLQKQIIKQVPNTRGVLEYTLAKRKS